MARLARYAHVSPDQFGRMTPARTRQLDSAVESLVNDEWRGYLELALQHAKLIATLSRGR
jgi:hypothetical protein